LGALDQVGESHAEYMMPMGFPVPLTWYKLFTDWGGIIGGAAALGAGAVAYWAGRMQVSALKAVSAEELRTRREEHKRDVQMIRRSLAVEIRHLALATLESHLAIVGFMKQFSGRTVNARAIDHLVLRPEPIVFPALAHQIALLEEDAVRVTVFYGIIAAGNEAAKRLTQLHEQINLKEGIAIAGMFLAACMAGLHLIPELLPGSGWLNSRDEVFWNKFEMHAKHGPTIIKRCLTFLICRKGAQAEEMKVWMIHRDLRRRHCSGRHRVKRCRSWRAASAKTSVSAAPRSKADCSEP